METFRVSCRNGGTKIYWLQARNDRDARHLVALNVPGAEQAERIDMFGCTPDGSKAPAIGFIDCSDGEPLPIQRL